MGDFDRMVLQEVTLPCILEIHTRSLSLIFANIIPGYLVDVVSLVIL